MGSWGWDGKGVGGGRKGDLGGLGGGGVTVLGSAGVGEDWECLEGVGDS